MIMLYIMIAARSDEMISALLGLDVQRMKALAANWGNIPRTLLQSFNKEDRAIEAHYCGGSKRAVHECEVMVDEGPKANFPDDPPSDFYFLRPMKTATGTTDHQSSYISVPTPTIRRILAEALRGRDNVIKLRFYHSLSQHANTRQAAGYIFESWFHSFFIVKKAISCEWVRGSEDKIVQLPNQSTRRHADLIPTTQDAPKSASPPYYWIPPKSNFPGIDSVLVLEKKIYAFQVTISASHKSPVTGLKSLHKMLPPKLRNLSWRVVFVGAEEGRIKSIAEHWDGQRLFFPTDTKRLSVGWAAVDPVQDGVPYTVCKFVDPSNVF